MTLKELKSVRVKLNLTQSQAAEKIGIDRSTLALLESGTRNPSYEVMTKISKAYGETIEI